MTDWDERYRAGEHINDEPHPLLRRFEPQLTAGGRALDLAKTPCTPAKEE